MTRVRIIGLAAAVWLAASTAPAQALGRANSLRRINERLCGRVIDHTHNHGHNHRIWSASLCEWRDLYVYLPPGFDPCQRYPVVVYLHGFTQDEQYFVENQVQLFDDAIASGRLPPLIIAIPDGSLPGRPAVRNSVTFFANSRAGRFEDFVIKDVWNFVTANYPIRPEREAHVLTGSSMGGSAAFALAIKHRDLFKTVVGFFPAVNLRWVDCHQRYMRNFDPCCWGWREKLRPCEVVGRFYGVLTVRFKVLSDPLFGRGPHVLHCMSRINPIELLDFCDVQPGELDMYIAYGGKDEFNIDAQVESFLHRAKERCLAVGVAYDPRGRHDLETGTRLFPAAVEWLAPLLAPYSPSSCPHPVP
jgi:pimeloyl-ACP methyl ester carboxylesterase